MAATCDGSSRIAVRTGCNLIKTTRLVVSTSKFFFQVEYGNRMYFDQNNTFGTSKTELAICTVKCGEEILYVSNCFVLCELQDLVFCYQCVLLTCFKSSKQESPVNILENGDLERWLPQKSCNLMSKNSNLF